MASLAANHIRVREECVAYLRDNREQYEAFVSIDGEEGTSNYEQYLSELTRVSRRRRAVPFRAVESCSGFFLLFLFDKRRRGAADDMGGRSRAESAVRAL